MCRRIRHARSSLIYTATTVLSGLFEKTLSRLAYANLQCIANHRQRLRVPDGASAFNILPGTQTMSLLAPANFIAFTAQLF
jgi:hypothetical protein